MQQEDRELIADTLGGRTAAFGSLVCRYQDRLYHSLVHMLGSTHDARDVAQEAFVHAYQKLHTFRGQSSFYSWLYRIAMNSAVSLHRKRPRPGLSLEAAREATGLEPADQSSASQPDLSLEMSERAAAVRAALAGLPDDFRQVLVLREMDGMSYEEIAETVDCPVGTVRSRIHRARLELKNRLEPLLKRQEV